MFPRMDRSERTESRAGIVVTVRGPTRLLSSSLVNRAGRHGFLWRYVRARPRTESSSSISLLLDNSTLDKLASFFDRHDLVTELCCLFHVEIVSGASP